MIRVLKKNQRHRPGVAIVEFAVTFPILLVLILGIWELGRMIQVQQVVNNAAREGARQASTGARTVSQIQTYVTSYLQSNGMNPTGVEVLYSNITQPAVTDPTSAAQMDEIQITIRLPHSNVDWNPVSVSLTGVTTLEGQANWRCMKDVPIEVDLVPPID